MPQHNEPHLLQNAFARYHQSLTFPPETEWLEMEISEKTETRMKKCFKRGQKLYYPFINTVGKRVACILAAVLIATSAVTVAADPFGELLENFTLRGSSIYFEGEMDWWLEETKVVPIQPDYLPKGYELLREKQTDQFYRCFFQGPEAEFFVFAQSGEHGASSFSVDSDYQVIKLSENQGAYFFEYPNSNALVFTDGTYLYRIHGTLSQKQLIKIARSVLK